MTQSLAETHFGSKFEFCDLECLANGVVSLSLARPESRNAFNAEMIAELSALLARISALVTQQAGVFVPKVLVLRGKGKVFCAGADLNYMKSQATAAHNLNEQDALLLAQMFLTLSKIPIPVVCAVQGAAIGGGFGLAVCADFVLATADAQFATSEVRLGLVPGVISPFIVRKLGVAHSQRFMLTGMRYLASECLQSGLVTQVVDNGENLQEAVSLFVKELLLGGPQALQRTKELVALSAPLPSNDILAKAAAHIACARAGEEGQEGLRAFFSKRPASWHENRG